MTRTQKSFELRGWHVFLIFCAFFGVVFAANFVLVTTATRSFPGEEASKAYARGLDYNAVLEAERAEAALGWIVEREVSKSADGVRVELTIAAANGRPLNGLTFTGALKHPASKSGDAALTFVQSGPGTYAALADIAPGAWILEFDATHADGARIDRRERIWID